MPNTIEYILKLEDQATQQLKEFGNQLNKSDDKAKALSGSLKLVGAATTAMGIAGFLAMKDWADAAGEAEMQMAGVNAMLQNVTAASDKQSLSFNTLQEVVKKTADAFIMLGFDDEETSVTMAKTLQITNDITTAQTAMAAAADLARYKNMSLTDASQALNLALDGNGRVLTQLGIVMKDHATQAEVIAAVNAKVGGTAKEMSNTYAVQMQVLGVEVTNLKENLGAQLLPMLTDFTKGLNGIVVALNGWDVEKFRTIVTLTASFTAAFLTVGPIMTFIGMLPQLSAGIGMLAGAIGIGSAAMIGFLALIPLAVGGIIFLALNCDTFCKKFTELTTNMGQVTVEWATAVWNAVKSIWSTFTSYLSDVGKAVGSFWTELGRIVKGWGNDAYEWGKNLITQFASGITAMKDKLIGEITGMLNDAKKLLEGHSPPVAGPLKEIDKWGYNIGNAWVKGFQGALGDINFPAMTGSGNQTTNNYSNNISVNAPINNNLDPYSLASILGQQLAYSGRY